MISEYSLAAREELTGAAGGERRGAVWGQPFQTLDVARAVEIALGVEIGDRERQQAGRGWTSVLVDSLFEHPG
jgi:hypothetical protein